MRVPRTLEPLRHRDFALLWSGQTVSMIGNFVNQIALPWQVLLLTNSAVQIGIVTGILGAAQLVFLLLGGAIVDRVPRRQILVATDLINTAVFLLIALLSGTNVLRVEHLYVGAAIAGATFSFHYPALQALIPEVVPAPVLVQANVLRSVSRQAGVLVGPLAAGALIAAFGPAAAFGFNAVTFAVAFAGLVAMRASSAPLQASGSILSQIGAGLRFTFSITWLWVTIFGFALVVAAYLAAWTGLPVLIRDAFRGDATTFGAITAATGLGELLGAFVVGQFRYRRVGLVMYLYTALFGLAMAGIGTAPSLVVAFAFAALSGICLIGFEVPWYSALQRDVPREYLGRVSSVDMFGGSLLAPIAPIVGGVLVAEFGPSPVFVAGGAVIAAFGLAGLALPSIRRLE